MLRSWLHKNAQQYVEATKSFMNSLPKGTLTRTRSNGDVIRYHETSNTFGVMTKDGTPRIMFKPGPLFITAWISDQFGVFQCPITMTKWPAVCVV